MSQRSQWLAEGLLLETLTIKSSRDRGVFRLWLRKEVRVWICRQRRMIVLMKSGRTLNGRHQVDTETRVTARRWDGFKVASVPPCAAGRLGG